MKIGVIGLGYWGPNLLRNLLHMPDVEVIGCDEDRKRIDIIKRNFPNAEYTTSCDFIDDPDVRAIVIATPVKSHYELAKLALEKDKDVFVEKPLTVSYSEAEDIVNLAEENNKILMVGHTFMFNPAVLKIKEIIESGEVGEIYYITSTRVNLGIHRKDANVIWDLAPHDFSIIFLWMDTEPKYVSAVGKDAVLDGLADVAFIHTIFDNGVIADIQVGWLAPSKIRRTIVVGSKKMIVYDETNPQEKVKIYDSGVQLKEPYDYGEFLLTYRTGDIHAPKIEGTEPLKLEMEHFVECIKKRKNPISDGKFALRIVKTLQMANESLKKNNGAQRA